MEYIFPGAYISSLLKSETTWNKTNIRSSKHSYRLIQNSWKVTFTVSRSLAFLTTLQPGLSNDIVANERY